jgi:hypothetical protein
MLATCTLTPLKCQLCGSALVRVAQPEIRDRLICPICWAAGDYEEVVQGIATLQRGVRIEKEIRRRVDKARFPRRDDASARPPGQVEQAPIDVARASKESAGDDEASRDSS